MTQPHVKPAEGKCVDNLLSQLGEPAASITSGSALQTEHLRIKALTLTLAVVHFLGLNFPICWMDFAIELAFGTAYNVGSKQHLEQIRIRM